MNYHFRAHHTMALDPIYCILLYVFIVFITSRRLYQRDYLRERINRKNANECAQGNDRIPDGQEQ